MGKRCEIINKEDVRRFIDIFRDMLNTAFVNQDFEIRIVKISDMNDYRPGSIEIIIDFWENKHEQDRLHR